MASVVLLSRGAWQAEAPEQVLTGPSQAGPRAWHHGPWGLLGPRSVRMLGMVQHSVCRRASPRAPQGHSQDKLAGLCAAAARVQLASGCQLLLMMRGGAAATFYPWVQVPHTSVHVEVGGKAEVCHVPAELPAHACTAHVRCELCAAPHSACAAGAHAACSACSPAPHLPDTQKLPTQVASCCPCDGVTCRLSL